MKIKITADSTCDLSPEVVQRYDIGIMPLHVVLGETSGRDGIDVTPQLIFDYVAKTGILPKTAAPSTEEYTEFFKNYLQSFDAVIHVNISAKASSSYDCATQAAAEFKGKVFTVDSEALSTGQGLLAVKACDLAAAGKNPGEIVDTLNSLRPKLNTSFVPDVLDYLHKGGRCSLVALLGAKVLKLHPMISMKDGAMYPKKKYMGGLHACLKKYVKDLAEEYPRYDKTRCFITHSSCERETVELARELVNEYFAFDEVLETVAGAVVTSHCGKNTLGVLFISE